MGGRLWIGTGGRVSSGAGGGFRPESLAGFGPEWVVVLGWNTQDAYTPEALVWASDWPFLRAPARTDYGPLLDVFCKLVPDAAAQRAVLWDTPRRLFGFTE